MTRSGLTVRVHCEDIPLHLSGGVANFARGMIEGFRSSLPAEDLIVVVAASERAQWSEFLGEGTYRFAEAGQAFRPLAGLRLVRLVARKIPLLHQGRAALRHHSIEQSVGASDLVCDYFPYHRALVYGERPFVTIHDLRSFDDRFADPASQWVIAENARRAVALFCSWEHPFKAVADRFPETTSKLHLVEFPPMLSGAGKREISEPESFLLYPSATSPHKNHLMLLKYAAECPESRQIICVGPEVEPQFSFLQSEITRLNLTDKVHLLGLVSGSELESLYRRCYALVMPTMFEAASGPIMEAFVRGIPVVSSDIEPLRSQIAESGGDACWFDAGSPRSLERAVLRLEQRYSYYETASADAGEWYRSMTWIDTARSYLEAMRASTAALGGSSD